MAEKQEKRVWQAGEEEFLIELWQKYDCTKQVVQTLRRSTKDN